LHQKVGVTVVVEVSCGQETVRKGIVLEGRQQIWIAAEPGLPVIDESDQLVAQEDHVQVPVLVQVREDALASQAPDGRQLQAGIAGSLPELPGSIIEKNDQPVSLSRQDGIEISIAVQISPQGDEAPQVAPGPPAR